MKLTGLIPIAATLVLSLPLCAQGVPRETDLGAGLVFPSGHLGDVTTHGYTFTFITRIPLRAWPVDLRIGASYAHFGRNENPTVFAPGVPFSARDNAAYLSGSLGLEYPLTKTGPTIPYALVDWGYFHGMGAVPSQLLGGDRKVNHLGGDVGGGVKFAINRFELFTEARYVTIAGGDKYVPIMAGVAF